MEEIQTTFLEDLRSKTASLHKSTEQVPISAIMVSDSITISDYAKYLNHMHTIISSTEDTIFKAVATVIPDVENRRKLQLIEQDLNQIQYPIKQSKNIFNGNYSFAFALGIMYVVEGSALGGRFLMKNINAVLGDAVSTHYFAGYGNHTGSSWKQFLDYLTTYVERENCAEETIAGAVYAFQSIHTQLNEAE